MRLHKFYLYDYRAATHQGGVNKRLLRHIGNADIDTGASDYPNNVSPEVNWRLPAALKKYHIVHFIPLKKPSFEDEGDHVSIYFYHNGDMYDIVYNTDPKYIMMPNGVILADLDVLYAAHLLEGWYDRRTYAE